jgi:hypothetical protein
MRRFLQLSAVCLVMGVVSACATPEQIVVTEDIPTAGVRFINAVPDTNAMDLRFVDIVESNAHYKIGFRNNPTTTSGVTASTQIEYKNTRAGSRHFRIFLSDTLQSIATFVLKDTTVTLEAGKLYTAMMWGTARTGGMKFVFYEETIPDPGTAVGLRFINTTSTTYEVRAYATTGTLPVAPTWTVPAYSRSAFTNTTAAQVKYNVQPAGGGTIACCYNTATPPALVEPLALIGEAPKVDIEGTPGTTIAGSAVTAIIFPASVAGSKAVQFLTNFPLPAGPAPTIGVSFMWDKRPPRPAGT